MTGMITVPERPQARHSGFGLLSAAPSRLSRIVSGGEKRHRHNQPTASAW
jgi:hypothetical protein